MSQALDIENFSQLLEYLYEHNYLAPNEVPQLTTLRGGVSSKTVLLERTGEAWVLKQALEKLRVAADWFSSPQRIHHEALGITFLAHYAPPGAITPLVFEDNTEHILAMQAVPHPHENWKTILLQGRLECGHVNQFAALLAGVHRNAFRANQASGEVAEVFADRQYFENLRLEPYYLYTAEQVPEAASFLHALVEVTRQRLLTLVHGDYSPKNVLVHRDKLILLDHEVIHFGDPAFDLGFGMTHLLSKAHHLPGSRDAFREATLDFWARYQSALGDVPFAVGLELYAVRHTLGCLLARVAGRSPLEYLSEQEKRTQKDVVLELMHDLPPTVSHLVARFTEEIARV